MPSVRLIGIDDTLRRAVEAEGDAFAPAYGASLGDSGTLVREVVSQTLALLDRMPRGPEWGGYLVADEEQAMIIGTCGFTHGPEENGSVEIAYFTFPRFEGRGYATAMGHALLNRALESDAVRDVIAHTLPERNASTRILEKIGFRLVGEAHDADAGKVWRWVYRRGGSERLR